METFLEPNVKPLSLRLGSLFCNMSDHVSDICSLCVTWCACVRACNSVCVRACVRVHVCVCVHVCVPGVFLVICNRSAACVDLAAVTTECVKTNMLECNRTGVRVHIYSFPVPSVLGKARHRGTAPRCYQATPRRS